MWKKPRSIMPEDMIYPDRCMLKWQGMILSDHNERMRFERIQEVSQKEEKYHTEAELENWDSLIMRSWQLKKPVTLVISRPNEPCFSVKGTVMSLRSQKIQILTDHGELIIFRHEVDEVLEGDI